MSAAEQRAGTPVAPEAAEAGMRLPEGRRGRLLALGLTAVGVLLVWTIAIGPILGWLGERQETLDDRRAVLEHMRDQVARLPVLRRESARAQKADVADSVLLQGDSDPAAAASLQQKVDQLAAAKGLSVSAEEIEPAVRVGRFRQIGVRLTLTAPWPALVGFLREVGQGTPRLLVDDLQIQGMQSLGMDPNAGGQLSPAVQSVDASLVVMGYRAGGASPRARTGRDAAGDASAGGDME